MNNRYDIDELLARISSEDRITCLYLASALKKELGLSGYGLFQEFCEKADNYQETWVAADWKSADKQQVTIGPLCHFTNRINEVGTDLIVIVDLVAVAEDAELRAEDDNDAEQHQDGAEELANGEFSSEEHA